MANGQNAAAQLTPGTEQMLDNRAVADAQRGLAAIREKQRQNPLDPARNFRNAPPNFGDFAIPQVVTFASLVSNIAKAYRNPDEAYRHSIDNARNMRTDLQVMECLEARQRACAGLGWHIEVDGPDLPHHKAIKERMTYILEKTPRFTEYRRALLEALWYGRQANQHRFGFRFREMESGGVQRNVIIKKWTPILGDKLVFRQDFGDGKYPEDQVGVRINPAWPGKVGQLYTDGRRAEITEAGMAVFLQPWERGLMAVHKHMIEDGAYEDPLSAGGVHGIGIRSRIYWTWFQKQELLGLFMEYLERSALGFEIWYYDSGNPKGREETEHAATNRIGKRNIVLFPKIPGEDNGYGVEHIEPGASGAEALQRVLNEFFGHQIKRYILGQTLTSEASATGLGSGLAELHLATLMDIIKYDATNLEETITTDVLDVLKVLNDPKAGRVDLRFVIDTQSANAEERMAAYEKAYNLGAKIRERDVMEAISAAMPDPDEPYLQKDEGRQESEAEGKLAKQKADQQQADQLQAMQQAQGQQPGQELAPKGKSQAQVPELPPRPSAPEEIGSAMTKALQSFAREGEPELYASLFDEDDHPRDGDGKFASKSSSSQPSLGSEIREAKGVKPGGGDTTKQRQKQLLSGLDAAPGQMDLFTTDGEREAPEADRPPKNESDYYKLADHKAALRANYFDDDGDQKASSRTTRADVPQPPVGIWAIDEYGEIAQLRELNPEALEYSENDVEQNAEGKGDDMRRYREWMAAGHRPPPITIVETPEGAMKVSDGHRRARAAQSLGIPVRAWVFPAAEPGSTRPMTLESVHRNDARKKELFARRGERVLYQNPEGTRWITLNGGEGHGTPVLVDGQGNIHGGPKALTGKNVQSLGSKGDDGGSEVKFDPPTPEPAKPNKVKRRIRKKKEIDRTNEPQDLTYQGKTQSLSAWAEELDKDYATLHRRIVKQGWPAEKALSRKVTERASFIDRVNEVADDYSINADDLKATIEQQWAAKAEALRVREEAKRGVRAMTKLTQREVDKIAEAGHDHSSAHKMPGRLGEVMRHFDQSAQQAAAAYPELGLGSGRDGAEVADKVWELLSEGRKLMPPKHDPDIMREAAEYVQDHGGTGLKKAAPTKASTHGGWEDDDDLTSSEASDEQWAEVKKGELIPFARKLGLRVVYAYGFETRREFYARQLGLNFDEAKHPRADDGKFTSGGGGGGSDTPAAEKTPTQRKAHMVAERLKLAAPKLTQAQYIDQAIAHIQNRIKAGEDVSFATQTHHTPLSDPASVRRKGHGVQINMGGKAGWLNITDREVRQLAQANIAPFDYVWAVSQAIEAGEPVADHVREEHDRRNPSEEQREAKAESDRRADAANELGQLNQQIEQFRDAIQRGKAMLATAKPRDAKKIEKAIAEIEGLLADNQREIDGLKTTHARPDDLKERFSRAFSQAFKIDYGQMGFNWDESQHPRDADGKFTEGDGAAAQGEELEPADKPEPEDPRAAAAAKVDKSDYAWARPSAVSNVGEDLLDSARHKRNAWRSLEDAETAGNAEELLNRKTLLKAEPHNLLAAIDDSPHQALTALTMHTALGRFPDKPAYRPKYDKDHQDTEESRKASRKEYHDTYAELKGLAEQMTADGVDAKTALGKMNTAIRRRIITLRGGNPDEPQTMMAQAAYTDRFNPTANALVGMLKATDDYRRTTNVLGRMNEFSRAFVAKYGSLTEDSVRDNLVEHAKDVMEGKSLNQTFGVDATGKPNSARERFKATDAYVKNATRKGGRMIDANTVKAATTFMTEKLGMRGVQFGNSVTDEERQHHLTKASEAFADMADVLGLPDEFISMGGKLGIAFGARGKAGASAHYEPSTKVINLTRNNGVGSLAHEWGHFFDNMQAGAEGKYASESANPEYRAWNNASGAYRMRLGDALLPFVRDGRISEEKARDYWRSTREVFARSFEQYVQHKLQSNGRDNTYLAGLDKFGDAAVLWPNAEEIKAMAPHFDKIFASVGGKPMAPGSVTPVQPKPLPTPAPQPKPAKPKNNIFERAPEGGWQESDRVPTHLQSPSDAARYQSTGVKSIGGVPVDDESNWQKHEQHHASAIKRLEREIESDRLQAQTKTHAPTRNKIRAAILGKKAKLNEHRAELAKATEHMQTKGYKSALNSRTRPTNAGPSESRSAPEIRMHQTLLNNPDVNGKKILQAKLDTIHSERGKPGESVADTFERLDLKEFHDWAQQTLGGSAPADKPAAKAQEKKPAPAKPKAKPAAPAPGPHTISRAEYHAQAKSQPGYDPGATNRAYKAAVVQAIEAGQPVHAGALKDFAALPEFAELAKRAKTI